MHPAGAARGAGKGAAPQTKEGTVAGRSFVHSGTGMLLILAVMLMAACEGGPATTPEPTPTPGAHFLMPTPMAPVTAPSHSPAPEMIKYIVQEGDTLYEIALRYDVTMDDLIRINKMQDPNSLAVGQELLIPLSPRETATPIP
jgi:LysM repeat protein